jgi:hypothetical protein
MSSCRALQFEDSLTPVSSPAILTTSEQVRRSFLGSRYLSRQNVFERLELAVQSLVNVSGDWNSYGSPAPTVESVECAMPILRALRTKLLEPDRVLPSADGGVAFTFLSDTINRAAIEALNSGESYVLLYDLRGNSETIEWPTTSLSAQVELIDRLAAHLRSEGLAAESK